MNEKQTRARYTAEFKQEAVRQVKAGRSAAEVARTLGVPKASLDSDEHMTHPSPSIDPRGGQVRRNRERPRTIAPEAADIAALVTYASTRGRQWTTAKGKEADTTRQWRIITMAAEFAALVGSRQMEFLQLHWPMFGLEEVRLRRGKQRAGAEKVERITVSPALLELRERLQTIATNPTLGAVFPNRQGNPYTADGFASMWQKLIVEAVEKQVIGRRFTFHDLRAYYTTQHKETTGALPDLHASPTTTARVYERSKVAKRKAL